MKIRNEIKIRVNRHTKIVLRSLTNPLMSSSHLMLNLLCGCILTAFIHFTASLTTEISINSSHLDSLTQNFSTSRQLCDKPRNKF